MSERTAARWKRTNFEDVTFLTSRHNFMASRFQRDSRSALFSSYDAQAAAGQRSSSRNAAHPPTKSSPYGLPQHNDTGTNGDVGNAAFSAYPGQDDGNGFRSATPNKKGQYSGAVLDELESQNEEQVGEMAKRVRMLKDITTAIGTEIRDSTAFAEKMNDQFEGTRNRLRGTMNRMLIMAERTGIGWRIWLGFFAFMILLFLYVWLF